MALAISSQQPFSEVLRWDDDRLIDTAWDLIHEAQKAESRGKHSKRGPGAGGPQYSG
jgi:hypothetical protein